MKREIGKLTVLMTAPIMLSLVWNIHASDKAPSDTRAKAAQPDTISISVPHTEQRHSLSKALSDSIRRRVRISISERYQSHYKPNTRDLLLRPADKAIYTTSDLLLRPNDTTLIIYLSLTILRTYNAECILAQVIPLIDRRQWHTAAMAQPHPKARRSHRLRQFTCITLITKGDINV